MQDHPNNQKDPADSNEVLDLNQLQELALRPDWTRHSPDERRFESRPPRKDSRSRSDRRPRQGGQAPRWPARKPAVRNERRPAAQDGFQTIQERRTGLQRRQEERAPLPVDIRFLPEEKQLLGLARKLQASRKAYQLMDLTALFLAEPNFCIVKIEVSDSAADVKLYQCKRCKTAALERDPLAAHILKDHVDDYFEKEESVGEAPAGQFACIAKCGLTGVLIAPPNHHSYSERVREIHRAQFPKMTLSDYESRIEVVRDSDLVEKWKEESRRQVLYRRKGAGNGDKEPPVKWPAVESHMLERVVPSLLVTTRRAVMTTETARAMKDRGLFMAIRDAWKRQNRASFTQALRAALRHKGFCLFKAGKGKGRRTDFVSSTKPVPLKKERAVDEIQILLEYLHDHPCCQRATLIPDVQAKQSDAAGAGKRLTAQLDWLIDKGHIIEFFDGQLTTAEDRIYVSPASKKNSA